MNHKTCLAYLVVGGLVVGGLAVGGLVVGGLVVGGLAAAAAAQPPGLAEFRVDSEAPGSSLQWVDVDAEPGGDFVMVWDTVGPGILARRFASDGEPASGELRIDTGDALGTVSPVVASLGGGAFAVVWERLEADDRDVVGQLFSSIGEPASEVFPVHAEAAEWQLTPDLASDREGGFVVIWLRYENDGDHQLFARRFASAGAPATGDLAIGIAHTDSGEPAVASDAGGDFVVVWLNEVVDELFNSRSQAFFRRYSRAGEPLTGELRLSFELEQRNPAVASEPDGDFVVVWSTGGPGRSEAVRARRFSATGEPLTDEILVADGEEEARVATDADGNFLVVWRGDRGYFGRHFSAAGEPQGGEFRVNQVAASLGPTVLAGDLAGNFVAAWERDDMAFARRLPRDGRAGALHFSPEPPYPVVPGMIEFGAIEDDRTVPVHGVIRTGGALGEVSVDYFTEPGSAAPGEDYRPAAGTLVFAGGDGGMKTFDLEILEDEEIEADETFIVRLANPQGGAPLVGSPTARVGIFADDFNPPELDPVPLGPERVVNARRQGSQRRPQVAVSPQGEFIVVWESEGEGVLARLFDREAAPRGGELQVGGARPAFQPSVAVDNNGDFLVVWQGLTARGESLFQGRHFAGDGRPRGQVFEIARAAGCVSNPFPECHFAGPGRLAAGIDGRFPAVWGIVYQPRYSITTRLWSGILGAGGTVAAAEFDVALNNFQPGIAATGDGGFVVAWSRGFEPGISARRFDRTGQPADGIFQIAAGGGGSYAQVALAPSGDGALTAGWHQARDVLLRGFDRGGHALSDPVSAPQFSLGDFQGPALGADPADNVVAVWVQGDTERGFAEDGSGSGIFARRFDAGLAPVSGEVPVNLTTAYDQRNPAVAVGRDGRFMVVWESEEKQYGDTDVMARAFASAGCVAHAGSLCFQDGRFQVEVDWRDFGGVPGAARGVTVADAGGAGGVALRSRDSAVVEFFGPENWEMLVKVLDGRRLNGHFWVFLAAATNVAYLVTVTDTSCGQVRTYENPLGRAAPASTDTEAFTGCASPRPASCVGDADTLCLGDDGRFRVEIAWRDFAGNAGTARQVSLAAAGPARNDDSGLFYFFGEENWEMLVKVLDGCAVNGHYWVFAATATDVEYTLRVTDTASNTLRTYFNPLRTDAAAVTDSRAFDACP